LSQGSWCVTPKQSNECVHLPGRLHGTSCLEEPSCRPRPGQVQRLDNLHGLDWDGPGLSQEVNGLKVGALSQRGFLEGRSFRHDLAGSGPGPIPTEAMMRFYQQAHAFYCGIDLHARTMYLCILNQAGDKVLHQEVAAEPAALLQALAPYRAGLVVACE